jgi:hypothetical protein
MQALENPAGLAETGTDMGLFSQEAVVSSLLDGSSRKILMSTIEAAKTVESISAETGVPLSSCYRKIADLVSERMLVIERMVMTPTGKKYAIYRSAISGIHIDMGRGRIAVSVMPNADVTEKVRSAWLAHLLSTA